MQQKVIAVAAHSTRPMTGGELTGAVLLGAFSLITAVIAGLTQHAGYQFHMMIFAVAFGAGFVMLLNRGSTTPAGRSRSRSTASPTTTTARSSSRRSPPCSGHRRFTVGLVIALQLAFPALNFDLPWTNFGRLRPLHTSAVIFAFGGNVLLATSFYVVQRTCHARLFGDLMPWFVVLGYNLFIVIAGTGYLLGITQGKEYAEPEWYADLFLTLVWVAYLAVFWLTILRRKEPHIYVANWFYFGFIVTIAVLHLGNNARYRSRS